MFEINAPIICIMKKLTAFFAFLVLAASAFAAEEDMLIYASDIRLDYVGGNTFDTVSGYHLYIRKKDGVQSVMLTETTKDPDGIADNYAFRALEYNSINGDEVRFLNGKPLLSEGARFSLIDSTTEMHEELGECFHIFIPAYMQYGYPWTRNGIIHIKQGTFINIRTFQEKYGDYSGDFADNPFMFDLGIPSEDEPPSPVIASPREEEKVEESKKEEPKEEVKAEEPKKEEPKVEEKKEEEEEKVPVLTDDYNAKTADSFKNIADMGKGRLIYSRASILPDAIIDSIEKIDPKEDADIVFAIDATGSMKDDMEVLRKELMPRLKEEFKKFEKVRVALLLYRDYGGDFSYKGIPVKMYPFTTDLTQFERNLNSFVIHGTEGGDIPEAVYEALYGSIDFYPWDKKAQRKVILIGDAPPHPSPRGNKKYTKDNVKALADKKGITIDAIIVPDRKSDRGRWEDSPF